MFDTIRILDHLECEIAVWLQHVLTTETIHKK